MADNVYGVNTSEPDKPYHHGELKPALVQAAFDLLQIYGLERLSLRSVAKRAGVSAMAPYRHFPDKGALLAAVAEHGFELLEERLTAADKHQDPRRALTDQALAYVAFAARYPDLFRLMYGRAPLWNRRANAELVEDPNTAYSVLARRISGMLPEDQVEDAVLTAWSFVHGLASLIIDRRLTPFPQDSQPLARRLAGFFANLLAAAR